MPGRIRRAYGRAPLAPLHDPEAGDLDLAGRRRGVGSVAVRTAGSPPPYDPELELLYQGQATQHPTSTAPCAGDNTYTDSIVAVDNVDAASGWRLQYRPHDLWDYDSTMENLLRPRPSKLWRTRTRRNCSVLNQTNGELVRVFRSSTGSPGARSPRGQRHRQGLPGRGGRAGALGRACRGQGMDAHVLQPPRRG